MIGMILSALISWFVSKSAANRELRKLQLTWEHEDIVSSDDEFAEMANVVAHYIQRPHEDERADAAGKISALRTKEVGALAQSLDQLYNSINLYGSFNTIDYQYVDLCLSEVINQKRKAQSHNQYNSQKKPAQ